MKAFAAPSEFAKWHENALSPDGVKRVCGTARWSGNLCADGPRWEYCRSAFISGLRPSSDQIHDPIARKRHAELYFGKASVSRLSRVRRFLRRWIGWVNYDSHSVFDCDRGRWPRTKRLHLYRERRYAAESFIPKVGR